MRLYWEVTRLSFKRQMAYRTANYSGLATNFFFGLLRAAVVVALFGARHQVSGISLRGAITYTGISQASIGFLNAFGWTELMNSVYTGEIAADLLKPLDFYRFWVARDLGRAAASFLTRSLTILAAYALWFGISTPNTPLQWAMVAVAVVLSWWICFSWLFLVNLAAFWTPDARGIGRLAFALIWFLSGFYMPLRFYPAWFSHLCLLTPFPSMVNSVVEVYLGLVSASGMARLILIQLGWGLAFYGAILLTLRAGIRRLVIVGG